ncbi:tripartite tricarboxylate transporter substrate binding protein [Siccirubricoccus sp. KC 17139]|uniref:Tripartite tricarboxylate transporter substrate binding protein n=1 Tax=Siccirubricoccus soli TaxID=2899147 RepID=A0ABT1CY61_9PROT|nr:tripartite tricarboxylate transporter substrate binding protein [Siccirubricoccus soli]MCO6414605.1 tripartite tricarboxylate transporter substrate binding protein [Siccirubricoccus soli]MCP2680735.1 tripartite tricarboxylate transporter substrate binding protein [Siccirubricoccus soli]
MHRRVLLAAPALLALPAHAQPWSPDRPIRILVPYTPGAINDTLARLIGEKMGDALGQLGVVENRPGASGSLAIAATAQAAPDGTTMVVANTANLTMNPFLFANTGYDPQKDLTPLATCARVMNALVVPANSPYRTLAELVAAAKANPGKLSYASSGAGSSPHLAAELFRHRTGTDMAHVPYRGSAPGLADLIAGRLDFSIDNLPNTLPHVEGGRLRALGVTGSERDPTMPGVPTFQEAGFPGYEVYVWFGFVGPARLPAPIRDRLADAIIRIANGAETAERIRRAGATVWTRNPAEFAVLIGEELRKWGTVIRAANLRIE